ncbi:MAG: BTAD domain-containing putative transcriptional regulator [Acidimicrobiia bacterium]
MQDLDSNVVTEIGLRIRVLGPLDAERDGASVDLGGPKQRGVLAMLLSAPMRALSRDRIIEGIWGDEGSEANRRSFHTYISNLRALLGDVIVRAGDTYRIEIESERLDSLVFEKAVDEARRLVATDPDAAATGLREALGLWRGRPYTDLVEVPGLEPEVRRLEELRLEAVELRIDAQLALGLHGTLVPELEALAEEHPTRERFRAQHMLVLYRSGRQAEALRAYRRTESFLAEEMGIEPSPELRDLELAILQHDESLLGGAGRAVTQRLAFLVTDIEGSTGLWDRFPQAMAEALAAHDRVLREAIEAEGGRVFKHTGDGVLAAFPTAVAAVRSAEATLRNLAREDWGEVGELRVRMGIDVGEAETRGGDFFGPPLNRAARLCAIGHGGQVLISAATQSEVLASAPAGLQVRQLVEVHLRGMATPERVAQLVFVGLPAEFPDLRVDADAAIVERATPISVPGYEARERIGEGAFGVVWRAYQPSVGREVALKVIRPELASQPPFVRRFEAEARTIARLAHPHIVPLIDFWRDTTSAYLVLALLPGGSLAEAMASGPVDPTVARQILRQVGAALDHAHSQGLSHGDLKPANVLLDDAGNAYLSDFGIAARLLDPEVVSSLSSAPRYRAPEEAATGPTPAADLYALGMLARDLLPGVAEIEAVLARTTALHPGDRYRTAAAFLAELSGVLGEEPPDVRQPVVSRNPYKGLRAFDVGDAADFYGRDELIATLVAAVTEHGFVTVVGPSGSGKSSVVKAGLLPGLARGAIDGSEEWRSTALTPGPDPFQRLAQALEAVSSEPIHPDELQSGNRGLVGLLDRLSRGTHDELVVVIDQLEELYTLVDSPQERCSFIDLIADAAEDPASRVRVVTTLRADFYDRPLEDERLGRLVRDGLVTVLPPTREELVQMITAPAQAVGLRWEPGLPHRIAEDVAHQPGGLPLLQYALTELVEHRSGDLLTTTDYHSIGEVAGALALRAETLYQRLTPAQQEAARQVLLRLVTVDENTDDSRRRVRRTELESLGITRVDLEAVLDTFTQQRLLLADRDPVTRGPTLEVAHEALLRRWPRLRGWIDEEREALVLGRRFRAALTEWEAADRHDDYLLTGSRLAPYSGWAETSALTPEERTYYQASRAKDEAERNARRRRRRTLTGSLVVGLLVVASLAATALWQWRIAEQETRDATARRLAGDSTFALAEDPERSVLLALEAADLSRQAGQPLLPEVVAALHQAVQTSRLKLRLPDGHLSVAITPDGTLLATDSLDRERSAPSHEVVIWDAVTGAPLRRLAGDAPLGGVEFRPGSSQLAVVYDSEPDEETSKMVLWDPGTGTRVAELTAPQHVVSGSTIPKRPIAWSPDGRLLGTVSTDANGDFHVTAWDVDSGSLLFTVPVDSAFDIVFPDSSTLLVAHETGSVISFLDARDGAVLDTLETPGFAPLSLVFDPVRNRLVIGSQSSRQVQAWDLQTRQMVWAEPVPMGLVSVSPVTGMVASSGNDGQVRLHDPEEGAVLLTLDGHTGAVWDLTFYPDGERIVSVGADGETRVWDVSRARTQAVGNIDIGAAFAFSAVVSPDGTEVAIGSMGSWQRFDLASGEPLEGSRLQGMISGFLPAPISTDWRLVAALDAEGRGWVRDVATGEPIAELPCCTVPKGFDPEGDALVLDGRTLSLLAPAVVPENPELRSRVIEVASGRELLDLGERGIFRAAFNPEGLFEGGRYLAVAIDTEPGSTSSHVEIHDMKRPMVASLEFEGDFPLGLAFDPTGRYLGVGTQNGRAAVVDLMQVADGVPPADALVFDRTLEGGGVPGVALTGDGIMATSAFGSLRLWDIATGDLLVEPAVEIDRPPFAAFDPAGNYLYYVDGTEETGYVLRRFPLDHDRLIEVAESLVTRRFTDDECRRYLDPSQCG